MAYFLQVKDKSGNYRTIDIKKSYVFDEKHMTQTYKRPGGYKLQELDHFTMLFEDEYSLKNHLLESGLLPYNLEHEEIVIRFIKKNSPAKKYKLLYVNDLAYFYVPNMILDYVTKKYEEHDFKFLFDLAKHFYWVRECGATASDLLNLSSLAINSGVIDKEFEDIDVNGDNIVSRFVKLLTYKYTMYMGNVIYNNAFNWRTFHMLISYINEYEKREIIKTDNKDSNNSLNPKIKVRKPEIIPVKQDDNSEFEQLSFGYLPYNQ